MSTEITLAEPQGGQITMGLARALAQSSWLPKQMQGNPSDVLLAMLTGRELGIGPMAALRLIYVVEGKPTLSGQLQLALLRRAGHEIRELEATAERVTFEGRFMGRGDPITVTYTAEEAKAAGLSTKNNWKSYPADMLYWRAVSRLARRLDPTATGGMYVPEDFDQRGPEVVVQAVAREPEPLTDEAGTPDMFEANRDGEIMAYVERLNFDGFSRRMTGKEIAESVAAGGWWEAVRRLEDRHRKACIDCQHIEAGFGSAA